MINCPQCTRSAPVEVSRTGKKLSDACLLQPHRFCSSICSETSTKNGCPYIYAIDSQSTKLRIMLSATEPTQALRDDGLVPGLCRLYLKGRCRQGDLCHQVHADPNVVEILRQEALHAPSCCHLHGAKCNFESFPLGLTFTLVDSLKDCPKSQNSSTSKGGSAQSGRTNKAETDPKEEAKSPSRSVRQKSLQQLPTGTVISIHSLCPTNYLWALYSQKVSSHIYLPKNKICREHQVGLCHFGEECNFLHLCREIPIDLPTPSNGTSTLHSPSFTPMMLHLERSIGSLPSNAPEGTSKVNNLRQVDLTDSFNYDNFPCSSLGSVNECNRWRQLTSEHACTYSGMLQSPSLNEESEPLLRPSGHKKNLANLKRYSVMHNPYMYYLQ
ncbi:unnamed protein product [Phytomonas sp. Hart1]|nr:unnamed protein product [Phytomonas sp. Hart1]|eukprot:CCW66278.1 unnamed protein product [Phytomonas sp. isolate Hart1]